MGYDTRFKKGHKHSPEVIEKIRQSKLGKKQSPEAIANRVASRRGYSPSEETRKKLSIAHTGKKQSPEQIEKHRQAMLGKIPWNKGMKMSQEEYSQGRLDWANKNRPRRTIQARRSHLKKKFGLSMEQYEDMLASQNNQCPICSTPFAGRTHIDHDHITGAIRAILCHNCNVGLGHFKDSPELLIVASEYIKTWKKTMLELENK